MGSRSSAPLLGKGKEVSGPRDTHLGFLKPGQIDSNSCTPTPQTGQETSWPQYQDQWRDTLQPLLIS